MDLFSLLKPAKALVVGDFMLDIYVKGRVERISPEAPVPVLHVEEETYLPGGAGNAIVNLISLGFCVIALGRVGNDEGGAKFLQALRQEGVDMRGLFVDPTFQTPLKKRMLAEHQQLLRVDYENFSPLDSKAEEQLLHLLPSLLEEVQVVAISDYAKGFLTPSLIAKIIDHANEKAIPIIVDPKGIDFKKYRGATVLKPNLGEAIAAARLDKKSPLEMIGQKLLEELEIEHLMITRSKEGITLFNRTGGRQDFPALVHDVKDVTGAGDTVLAVVAASLANKLELAHASRLANLAAGIAIERVGCARISLQDLSSRL